MTFSRIRPRYAPGARGFEGTYGGGTGTTDRVACGSLTPATIQSYAAWAWLDPQNNSGSIMRIHEGGADLWYPTTSNVIGYQRSFSTAAGTWTASYSRTTDAGRWILLGVTYDAGSTSNDPVFWFNGATRTGTETGTPSGSATTTASDLYVGNRSALDRCYQGRIAMWACWQGILLGAAEYWAMTQGEDPRRIAPSALALYVDVAAGTSSRGAVTVTGARMASGPIGAALL